MLKPSPLLEKRVLIPRGEKQAKTFSQLIEKYGGIPIEIPLIEFRPIEINQHLKEVFTSVDTYDWIIFTSSVTVETFFSFIKHEVDFPKIAVIGKKTAETLQKMGIVAQFIPTVYVAESFINEFSPYIYNGMKVLIPKGNLAREYIATSLTELGANVKEVIIYETYFPEDSRKKLADMISKRQLDILMFTSPSTVDHFMGVVLEYGLKQQLNDCITCCIGPSTENKLHEYGLMVHASPKEYTVKEMVASTIAYLEQS